MIEIHKGDLNAEHRHLHMPSLEGVVCLIVTLTSCHTLTASLPAHLYRTGSSQTAPQPSPPPCPGTWVTPPPGCILTNPPPHPWGKRHVSQTLLSILATPITLPNPTSPESPGSCHVVLSMVHTTSYLSTCLPPTRPDCTYTEQELGISSPEAQHPAQQLARTADT